MTAPRDDGSGLTPTAPERARFRRNLARVLAIQGAALLLLWLLQLRYGR